MYYILVTSKWKNKFFWLTSVTGKRSASSSVCCSDPIKDTMQTKYNKLKDEISTLN